MIKALRFCYGTAFVFQRSLQTASKTVSASKNKLYRVGFYGFSVRWGSFFEKTNPKTTHKRYVFFFFKNAPLGFILRVIGFVFGVRLMRSLEVTKPKPIKTNPVKPTLCKKYDRFPIPQIYWVLFIFQHDSFQFKQNQV